MNQEVKNHLETRQWNRKNALYQVYDTFTFEIQRQFKKTLILFGIVVVAALLDILVMDQIQISQGQSFPSDPKFYVQSHLSFISFLIYISACAYGGSMIAADFDKQTGNILFPKISRSRLFVGRFLGVGVLNALVISAYYLIIALFTLIRYDMRIPKELGLSLGWALFVMLTILSFVIFFSSFMKSTSLSVILAIVFLMVGFELISGIYQLATNLEPVFILTYYSTIIIYSIFMPEIRYQDTPVPLSETDILTLRTWFGPTETTAALGLGIYLITSLFFAYLIFRRRQK